MGRKYQSLADVADEARGGDIANKAISWYVNPSNRHYNVYLDSLRHQQAKSILNRYGGQEGFLKAAEASGDSRNWMKAWGKVIDRLSGRGSLGKAGSLTAGDVQVLFSMRNLASKFQRLTSPFHFGLLKTNPDAYLYQLRETAATTAALGTTLALIGSSGIAEIENGKVKIGKTRIDITGGLATIVNAANNVRKAIIDQPEGGFARTGWDVTKDFFQNQLSPMLGTIGRILDIKQSKDGLKDKYGNTVDAGWWLQNAPLPAIVQTAMDSQGEGENWWETARNVFSESLGFGANTYMSSDDKKKEAETALRGQYDVLAKYLPEGTDELTDDLITKIADDTFWAGDWDAYAQTMEASLDKVTASDSSTKDKRDKAKLELDQAKFYQKNDVSPELIDQYNEIGVALWRKMGDPDSEDYNPELYEALADLDAQMTDEGISFNNTQGKGAKYPKYVAKKSGSGRSKRANVSVSFEKFFGTPTVRQYDETNLTTGDRAIPVIKRVRPNIYHKITQSR
jgi:hypothetical protein